ncbi:MAG: hypothetical protein JRH01_23230 [Deltaproteobacteria bacterium]|nr:hypothetical protein [Deltaproteobacteria bacterium]MBW2394477.1 hypothetical protein [Deltaproteobacteria bacterium]
MLAIVAALAAVAASLGDLMLLTAADAPPAGLIVGHYLGVLGIPLYALGYSAVARLLAPSHSAAARVVFGTGLFAAAIGGTVHGVTAVIIRFAADAQPGSADSLQPAGAFLLPLWVLLGIATVLASGFYARAVASGATALPRWMAVANPLMLVLSIALIGSVAGPAQRVLVLAAPNLAHVMFFALVAWTATQPD